MMSEIFKGVQLLKPIEIVTPFGRVETPAIELPPLKSPSLERRHVRAFGHAVGVDASDILGIIPWVGGLMADSIRAMHTREIRKLLTPDEYNEYTKWDKTYPDALAILRSRIKLRE